MAKTKKRPDGRYEIVRKIKGVSRHFYGKTKAEAERKYAAALLEEDKGPLFKDAAKEWMEEAEAEFSANTLHGIKSPCEKAVEQFGNRRLREISAKEVKDWVLELADKGYSKKTISNHLSVVSCVYRYAQEQNGIDENPARFVRMPKNLPQERRELPSDEDDAKMMDSLSREKFALFLLIAKYTGARKGEIMGLRYEDFDLKEKTVRIERSVYFDGKLSKIKEPKTEAGIRTVPLLEIVERFLPKGKGYLFGGSKPWTKSQYAAEERAYRERTGVTASPHQWRHLYATILYDADIPAKDAQVLLGHARIATTMDVYTHVRDQRLAKASAKLEEFVKKSS